MDIRINETDIIAKTSPQPSVEKTDDFDFSFTLKRIGSEGLEQRLSGLIDDITVQGKRIAKHMDIKDLKNYRSLIGEFINEVVTNSHEFTRENFLDRRGRHRVYGIVKLVNKELDSLAQDLLEQEKDHMQILERTDSIRGMLLDILI